MRFVDDLHRRIWRIAKFNNRIIKQHDKDSGVLIAIRESATIKLPTFNISTFDFDVEFGWCVTNTTAIKPDLVYIVKSTQPINDKIENKVQDLLWYKEFILLEKELDPKLIEVEKLENQLIGISKEISEKTS